MDPSTDEFAAYTRRPLTKCIRCDYPYMKSKAIQNTVDNAVEAISTGVEAAKPQMAASKSKSGFFSLPAEIRNEIYHLALASEGPNPRIHSREPRRACKKLKTPVSTNVTFPKILYASQQIRNEALPIFLSSLEVDVNAIIYMTRRGRPEAYCERDQAPLSKSWIVALGSDNAKLIKRFELWVERHRWSRSTTARDPPLLGTNRGIFDDLGFGELRLQHDVMKTFVYSGFPGWKWDEREPSEDLVEPDR